MGTTKISRRGFLRAAGWSAVGITVLSGAAATGCGLLPPLPYRGSPSIAEAGGWIQLLPSGVVRVVSPRQEMGQGIFAAMAVIVAGELNLAPADIEVVPLSTSDMKEVRATVGSDSVRDFSHPLAIAAATLRSELARRAAAQLAVPVRTLRLHQGGFETAEGERIRRIELSALAAGRAVVIDPSEHAPNPAPQAFSRASSMSERGPDRDQIPPQLHDIVTGAPVYAADVMLPGMLHGRMLAAPMQGAQLATVSFARARQVDGYVTAIVDRERQLIGVVARDRFCLDDIARAVEVEWQTPPPFEQADIDRAIDVDRAMAEGLEHALASDDIDDGDAWDVDLRIDIPLAAHGTIEPRCAVARVEGRKVDIWTGSQDPFYVRAVIARTLDRDEDDVIVHNRRMGGAFGSRTICTVERDAAILAQAAQAPVKVQWSRPDEFSRGFHRPPSSHRIRARLGRDGRVADWWHGFASGHVLFTSAALPPWLQTVTSLVADKGVGRGAVPPYRMRRRRIEFSDVRLPIDTGPWRGLGAAPNTFAVESAMNQLARKSGTDAVRFRLDHLGTERKRLAACIKRAAELIDWHRPRAAKLGVGIACGRYKDMTDVAVAAEVQVQFHDGEHGGEHRDSDAGPTGSGGRQSTGAFSVRVLRMTCAQDCGLVLMPSQVRAQIEGNLLWGLGMALIERLPVAGTQVAAGYFSESPLPTCADTPRIDIALLGTDQGEPAGAGEPAIVAAAAAIANAVAAVTESQPTRLPIM